MTEEQINRSADNILQQFYPFKDREDLKRQAARDMEGYQPGYEPEPDRLTQINQEIEELEAKIAADRASRERGHELYSGRYKNNPMYKLALFDYVINGDRTGLDNFDKNERAITEAEANRQNAIALALMNKAAMAQSELGKLREKKDMLQADIDAIDELLKKSPNNVDLLTKRAKSVAQMKLVNEQLGIQNDQVEDPKKSPKGATGRAAQAHQASVAEWYKTKSGSTPAGTVAGYAGGKLVLKDAKTGKVIDNPIK